MPESLAARKVRIINKLTHTKGPFAGQRFNLRPWQERRIIRPLFQTARDGRRLVRMALLMLPRKNGKSELAAALALDGLLFDDEPGAEVYSAAADRDQASLVFNVAAAMVRADAVLAAQVEILDSQRRMVHRKSGSVYRAISAEAYSKHGFNASRVIYDELHAAPSRDLWDVLVTSTGGRAHPLILAISTAGYDRRSILWEIYQHAKRVEADPALDPSFLPILYEAPPDAEWTDENVWHACNPALGDFRSLEEMRAACRRAREIPAQENTFKRLYLNQWTEQASRWITVESWDRCAVALDEATLAGRRCYVGLDLSSTTDLTSAVAVFPDDDGGGVTVYPHFFMPEDRIPERVTRDRVPYDAWARAGLITATPGPVVNYDVVRRVLGEWGQRYRVQEIAVDPWNATDLITRLETADGFHVVTMRQGFATLSAPTKALETAILGRTLRHGGHEVLRWNIQNVSVEQDDAGNLKPSKLKSSERIDGVVALIMALDCVTRQRANPEPQYQMIILGAPA